MAEAIKRHWLLLSLNALAVVALVAALLLPIGGRQKKADAAAGEVPASPSPVSELAIDAVRFSQIERLRQELCLTDADLAAYGCTQEAADGVLLSLRSWHDQNRAALSESVAAQRRVGGALRDTWQKIHMGPKDQAALNDLSHLEQVRVQADAANAALLAAAVTALSERLTPAQSQGWATARSNAALAKAQGGMPSAFRYVPGLTAAQVKSLKASAADKTALLGFQELALASAAANQRALMPGVLAATQRVLPRPKDLIN